MKKFRLTFLALSRSIDLEIESENDIDEIVNDFLFVFAKDVDYENFKINIECLQQNTEGFRNKFDIVIQKYKGVEPKIQQLNSYLKDLKEDEHFFFFPNAVISKDQSFQYYNYLSALENDEDYEKLTTQIDDLFGELRQQYELFAFDENTRNKVGEPDKSKRICRFCKKSMDDITFKKVAHSISEALGNKKIITNDECDSCNEKFGSGIENDLITYLNLYRNVFGIKGKNGIPKLKGKNYEIENNGTIEIKHILSDEELDDPNRDDLSVTLETHDKITAQNIYRTLSKYAIGVLDSNYLQFFEETIDWINGEKDFESLPKVALLMSYELFSYHPKLMVYIRKNENTDLPYAVAEFRFTFLTFVYIIPKSSKDSKDFLDEDEYGKFWNFFKHYNSVKNWSYKSMDDTTSRKFIMNLKFEPKEKK